MNAVTEDIVPSVHLADFPKYNQSNIDVKLEERMAIAQTVSSMILALRRIAIKVRQPLQKVIIPKISEEFAQDIAAVAEIIKQK